MTAGAASSPFTSSLARAHASLISGAGGGSPAAAVRRAALDRFIAAGLPGGRDENWKYLQLRSLARREFNLAAVSITGTRRPEFLLPLADAATLIFVDGHFDASSSSPLPRSQGVRVEALRETYARQPELVASALPADDRADTRFALLNTAFAADGASIVIEAGELPLVYVVFVATQTNGATASFPRLRIRAAGGARTTVVEHHVGAAAGGHFVNSLTEVDVVGGARVDLCRLHALAAGGLQIDSVRARVGAASRFAMHCVAVGGDLLRSDIDVALQGEGAAADMHGLLFSSGTQHHELHAEILHSVARTTSRTHVRTVVNDTARAVCNSKVTVPPGAARSVSEQQFRNLLLAPAAEADTRPQLEIHNEDVKCSHGASTGRLDPNMLFYLMSRGLDAATARGLLTYAFVVDILRALPVAELGRALARRLAGELPDRDLIREFV
jgi:Fe-S cluster assembly protein SufD